MEVEVAYADAVPRHADLALFVCGEALRRMRGELRQHPAAAAPLYAWFLRSVCFLHVLPNDADASGDDCATTATDTAAAAGLTGPSHTAAQAPLPPAKDVSFRQAHADLRRRSSTAETSREAVGSAAAECGRHADCGPAVVGRVHPRSSPRVAAHPHAAPADVGFALLRSFLQAAAQAGGPPLVHRLAEALCDVVTATPRRRSAGTAAAAAAAAAPPPPPPAASAATVSVAELSDLFNNDLLDDELSAESGSATVSFCIWVTYEWASASFARQAHLASVVTTWVAALRELRDSDALLSLATSSSSPSSSPSSRGAAPVNIRRMYAALEGVFEGQASAGATLMELSLAQRTPHLMHHAMAKLVYLQGPPTSALLTRAELGNRGTQPTLLSITSGMLLYAQYHLSLHSLAVARQCARVALQVAQEVQSNAIHAMAHYTAHVVATHQGRLADAANSIAIALQLTLPNSDGASPAPGSTSTSPAGADAHMASLAFLGAAQLLLLAPGAVGPALRSAITAEHVDGSGAADVSGEEGGDGAAGAARQTAATEVQTVAQCARHALLRAELTLLHAPPPPEGRCMTIVASLQRETLRVMGAIYGVSSAPLVLTPAVLRELLDDVAEETASASPLLHCQPSRTLMLEALRHAAHHALALQEGLLLPPPADHCGASTGGGSRPSVALHIMHTALDAVRVHYGATAAAAAASGTTFFDAVARYCVGCRLHADGYVAGAADVWTRLAAVLRDTAGVAGDARHVWPPEHLLLFTALQRRRAQAAQLLGHVEVPHALQSELLAVSSSHAFPWGVLAAQLIEAQAHQQQSRFGAALGVARGVERAAARIGYPSLCEAARVVQATSYSSGGAWRESRQVLARCRPTTASQRVSVLLQQYAVHLEPLLLRTPVPAEAVACLTRSWVAVLHADGLVEMDADGTPRVPRAAALTAVEELCLYTCLQRAYAVLGYRTDVLARTTLACMQELESRQRCPTPDLCLHGSCEELCRFTSDNT
ncbi:hypothetical protein NESM_000204400 [Novymonas esmeraldas]|uniref:Uncharacterized protein n=1 Tax=Novymonas esmeraldas TaxID=1808958 RepID=A0AAW0F8S5_9TRYP